LYQQDTIVFEVPNNKKQITNNNERAIIKALKGRNIIARGGAPGLD